MSPARHERPAADVPENPADLLERLTSYDECLRLGLPRAVFEESTVVDSSDREIKPLFDCLDLLEAAWPRAWRADHGELPKQIGRFQLQGVLGIGGFGIVYKAYDPRLRRHVALKVPRLHSLATKRLRERFQREARAAAALDHPNIVPIHEVGEEGATCYIVAAYCDGPNLAEWLQAQTGPVPVRVAADLAYELASALHYSHAQGVLHRDLKPSNVLLVKEDHDPSSDGLPFVPRVSDFGLAKVLEDETSASMSTSMALGTPAYMAPEQAGVGDTPIGPPADVYGLGAILYDVLCRRPPFQGPTIADVFEQLRSGEPVPPRRLRREIPRDLEAICLKCLEKEPARRYASAGNLADDLQRFLRGEPTKARPHSPGRRMWRTLSQSKVRSRLMLTVLLVGIAALSGVAWQFHQASVAARVNDEAQRQKQLLTRRNRYPLDLHYASNLLLDPAVGGIDRAKVAARAIEVLAQYVPQTEEPDMRGFEWHYLWQMLHPSAATPSFPKLHEFSAHQGDAYCVTFSPHGNRLATAGKDGLAHVWDAATGQRVLTLNGHTNEINWVEFAPDNKTLATCGDDRTARLWNAESGEQKQILWSHSDTVVGVSFNPVHPQIAAVANDGTIRVWELPELKEIWNTVGHEGNRIEGVAWSRDGRLLATVDNSTGLRIWDGSKSFAPYEALPQHAGISGAVGSSQDGRLIAFAPHGTIDVLEIASKKILSSNGMPGYGIRSLFFLNDHQTMILVGHPSSTGLLDWRTGKFWDPFAIRSASDFWCAAVSRDGQRIAMTDATGILRIWDSSPRRIVDRMELPLDLCHDPRISVSSDGMRLVVSERVSEQAKSRPAVKVSMWNISTDCPERHFDLSLDQYAEVHDIAFAPDGQKVAVGYTSNPGGHAVCFFDAMTGAALHHAYPDQGPNLGAFQRIVFSPDGSDVVTLHGVSGEDGAGLRLWTSSTGNLRRGISIGSDLRWPHGGGAAAFSPKGDILATSALHQTGALEFFRLQDLDKIDTWEDFGGQAASAVAFTPDGKRVVIRNMGGDTWIRDRKTGETIFSFTIPNVGVNGCGLAMSADGRTLALNSTEAVVLVQVDSGATLCVLPFPTSIRRLTNLTFSANGNVLIACVQHDSDQSWHIYLWRIHLSDHGGPPS